MYNDYDVMYESSVNQFIIPMLIAFGIILIIGIIFIVSLMKIFKKANRSSIGAIIPVYNLIVMFEIVNRPIWQILLFFVPIVNIIIYFDVFYKIAKSFRKSNTFAICTALLPFVFFPILGFSDSEYMGINNEAMEGTSVAVDLPLNVDSSNDNSVTTKTVAPPIDISIGGGIYQKDYEESLLTVPDVEIKEEPVNKEPIYQNTIINGNENRTVREKVMLSSKNGFSVEEENMGNDLLNGIDFINTNPLIETKVSTQDTISQESNVIDSNTVLEDVVPIPEVVQQTLDNLNVQEEVTLEKPVLNISSNMNQDDYVSCPNCGSVVKKAAGKCFMCGKQI